MGAVQIWENSENTNNKITGNIAKKGNYINMEMAMFFLPDDNSVGLISHKVGERRTKFA